jgi:hypothetical protein
MSVITEALALSQLGWSLVPLKPRSKEPLMSLEAPSETQVERA